MNLQSAYERERRESYALRLELAESKYLQNDTPGARAALEGCPADLRGWEWHFLDRLFGAEIASYYHSAENSVHVQYSEAGPRVTEEADCDPTRVWSESPDSDGFCFEVDDSSQSRFDRLAFSFNGKFVASIDEDAIKVWEWESRSVVRTFQDTPSHSDLTAFSSDGATLATVKRMTGGEEKTQRLEVKLWDVSTGNELDEFHVTCQEASRVDVNLSPDGKLVAVFDETAESLHVRDKTGKQVSLEKVRVVTVSPNGQYIAFVDHKHQINVWDWTTENPPQVLKKPVFSDLITKTGPAFYFSPEGQKLGCMREQRFILWDLFFSKMTASLELPWGTKFLALAPHAKLLATKGQGPEIMIWDLGTEQPFCKLRGCKNESEQAAFTPDGRRLVSAAPGEIKVWDLSPHRQPKLFLPWSTPEKCLLEARDGHPLISTSEFSQTADGRRLRCCRVDSYRVINLTVTKQFIQAWVSRKEETTLACGDDDWTISFVAQPERRLVITNRGRAEVVGMNSQPLWATEDLQNLVLSPDGHHLAVFFLKREESSCSQTFRLYELKGGQEVPLGLEQPQLPDGSTCAAAFSPDSRRLALCRIEKRQWSLVVGKVQVLLWDLPCLADYRSFEAELDASSSLGISADNRSFLVFSPDGRYLSVGGSEGLCLWDTTLELDRTIFRQFESTLTTEPPFPRPSDRRHSYGLAFSTDMHRVFAPSRDGVVIWNATPLPTAT